MSEFFPLGRMMSGSKSGYKGGRPVWNANICTRSKGKIWYGDLDLAKDAAKLSAFAKERGEPIYILKERDARFENEANPRFDNAVAIVKPDGMIEFCDDFV